MTKKKWLPVLLAALMLSGCAASDEGGSSVSSGNPTFGPLHEVYTYDPIVREDEKTDGMSNLIWFCPHSLDNGINPEYVNTVTDASQYPTVLSRVKVLKLYVEYLGREDSMELERLADFVREHNLMVSVEVGGVRLASHETPDDEMGAYVASAEVAVLQKFTDVGGRVDYITTDHGLSDLLGGRDKSREHMTMQQLIAQQMEYFKIMKEYFPNLKLGAIDSLGYFWVKGEDGRQYKATDSALNRVDFEEYISEYLRIAGENGLEIDHFHIDFGKQDVEYDKGYGRILAVEKICHSHGLNVGFIAANAFHTPLSARAKNEQELANMVQSAVSRTQSYFEGYIQAGGDADYLVLQRWQPYPVAVGPETDPLSQLGIFKTMIDSPLFPR